MGDMPQKSIRFPPELYERIEREAESQDRSFSWVVLRAVEQGLGHQREKDEALKKRLAKRHEEEKPLYERLGALEQALGSAKAGTQAAASRTGPAPARTPFLDPIPDEELLDEPPPKAERLQRARSSLDLAMERQQRLNKSKGF